LELLEGAGQIVILGCGYDTSFYELKRKGAINSSVNYFELDFPDQIERKVGIINSTPTLLNLLTKSENESEDSSVAIEDQDWGVGYGNYKLLNVDLREAEATVSSLFSAGFDSSLPTLILSECVLVYLEDEFVTSLLSSISSLFTSTDETSNASCVIVSYDMISPNDRFGQMMTKVWTIFIIFQLLISLSQEIVK